MSDKNCLVQKGLKVFEGKWNARVLHELILMPTMRFGELRKAIPAISNTMLAVTLRELEERGPVCRQQFNEVPTYVEYSMTESGKAFAHIFEAIGEWSQKYGDITSVY